MISYRFVPISSQKGVLFFETPGITTNTNDNKEDGVTKPFSRAFGEKLDQGPGHSEVLLCSQMCQYSRVFQKGDTPLYGLTLFSFEHQAK